MPPTECFFSTARMIHGPSVRLKSTAICPNAYGVGSLFWHLLHGDCALISFPPCLNISRTGILLIARGVPGVLQLICSLWLVRVPFDLFRQYPVVGGCFHAPPSPSSHPYTFHVSSLRTPVSEAVAHTTGKISFNSMQE